MIILFVYSFAYICANIELKRVIMNKPLFADCYNALEYNHLFKSPDNMNFYSAKQTDNDYIMVDDYDCGDYNIWSETPIIFLVNDKLLCRREEKYGVVNAEGLTIIPFVYDRFEDREEIKKDRYNVLLGNRWGVIDSCGKEIFRVKYNSPIPTLKQLYKSTNSILCRNTILVEDADTHRQGLVDFNGQEVIPTIYSRIERSGDWDYVYVNLGAIEETEPDCTWNGLWGCYNWQGKEVIPVKYHAVHYLNKYFIAGDDEYEDSYNDDSKYYGLYDLYDLEGIMIIGGFNNCQIGVNYLILHFGIVFKSYWKKTYWSGIECGIEYGEELVKDLNYDKMCSIIVDKKLTSFIPRHLIEETHEEIVYEFDFLCNNLPTGEGLLIGECPKLRKGKRYSENDGIIKGISVSSAFSINDNIVIYNSNKEIVMDDCSIVRLKGIVFCNEPVVIAPVYIDVKLINDELLFFRNENSLIGIRNAVKELLAPQFSLITNPYDNIAIGFKIKHIEEDETHQCQCCLLKFYKDAIHQEDIVEMTGGQLYELLYPTLESSDWGTIGLSKEHEMLITQYWKHIPHNDNDTNRFWYPLYKDFKYLRDDEYYEGVEESMSDNSTDSYNWEYYNDGLDMDQQDERFWNF